MTTNSMRTLGQSGIEVSPLGLGCMGLTHASGDAMTTPDAARMIREAYEMGYTFFDTAECYVEPEEVAGVMAELIQAGKIRAWGISEVDEDYLRRANAVCPVAAVQNRYSMLARWHEPLFPVLEEQNVALVAFSPMANGFLTGKYSPATQFEGAQDYRNGMPQYTAEGYEKDRAVLDLIQGIADEKGATLAQVSLAWMLCKKPWIVPIPGSRKPERLRENLGAADVALAADEVAAIDRALDGMDLAVFGGHARA